MAPPKVYGKRRTVYKYDSFFSSPERPNRVPVLDDTTSGLANLKLSDGPPSARSHARKPLVSVNANIQHLRFNDIDTVSSLKTSSRADHNLQKPDPRTGYKAEPATSASLDPSAVADEPRAQRSDTRPQDDLDAGRHSPIVPEAPESTSSTTASPSSIHKDLPPDLRAYLNQLLPFTSAPITPFSTFTATIATHFTITKLAEASFSQVFLLTSPALPTHRSVLKLIPLLPQRRPSQPSSALECLLDLSSAPEAVASELRLLSTLTSIPGFTNHRGLHLVTGRPGAAFGKACRDWNREQRALGKIRPSCFPDPNRKDNYAEDQLWAVVEMADAGRDVEWWAEGAGRERWEEYGMLGVWDVFWQTVLACGKGEVFCRWESRDLHLGNVCIRERKEKVEDRREWLRQRVEKLTGKKRRKRLGLSGLMVSVIDYTISRAEVDGPDGKEVAFIDLSEDEALFEGDGDVEHQYDIYRYMRAAVFHGDPLAEFEPDEALSRREKTGWQDFHPETNVIWLHFILDRLMTSATTFVDETAASAEPGLLVREQVKAKNILGEVQRALDLTKWATSGIRSAGDLVNLAVREGWLSTEDVLGLPCEQSREQSRVARQTKKPSQKRA